MAARGAHHYLTVFDDHTNEVLHLGRAKRCATPPQWIALLARDRGCTRPGCTAPGYHSQVHHAAADSKNNGQTNINDLTLACGPDNRLIENTGWTTTKNPQGPHRMAPTTTPDKAESTTTTTPTDTYSPNTTKDRRLSRDAHQRRRSSPERHARNRIRLPHLVAGGDG